MVLNGSSLNSNEKKLPYTDLAIGIDMGLKHFMTDSHGDVVDNPRFFRKSHGRLKKLQQRLAKKKKKSNRRRKSVKLVAKAHKKVCNQRNDFHQKEARILVDTFETIIFEDLSQHNKTSQICSACHAEGEHKDLSVRTHICIHCGVVLDRDHNAAPNIRDRGLGRSLRETASMGTFRGATA